MVKQQFHTNHQRERSWRKKDTELLETLEINGVIFLEQTLAVGLSSSLIPSTTLPNQPLSMLN
jgi:hypothetical protein